MCDVHPYEKIYPFLPADALEGRTAPSLAKARVARQRASRSPKRESLAKARVARQSASRSPKRESLAKARVARQSASCSPKRESLAKGASRSPKRESLAKARVTVAARIRRGGLVKCFPAGEHGEDQVHAALAGLGFLGGLQTVGDSVAVGLVERIEEGLRFTVFGEGCKEIF